jgi:predicted kinase
VSSTVLLVTGTCGSGKTTVSTLLGNEHGWSRIAEDEIWPLLFGRERGGFGSAEHRRRRAAVHATVFAAVREAVLAGRQVVVDATVHEAPPEAFLAYRGFLENEGIPWMIRVLHPSLEVAIARDAARPGWHAGSERIASLRAKYTGTVFPSAWFVDTSDEAPAATVERLTSGLWPSRASASVRPDTERSME